LARLVVTAVAVEGRAKSEVARDYGLSRRWVQKLVARYEAEGDVALEARSRRPLTSPQRVGGDLEDQIVAMRKSLREGGLDAGAATIHYHLSKSGGAVPSVSTIWRVLSRRGFVVPEPHKRPKSSIIRFQAEQPNERWQADITHWILRGGTEVEILNQLDDHSRKLVGSDAARSFKAADVVASFQKAASVNGFPATLLTDNAAVFTGAYRGRGWVALERELVGLGIGLRHSRPYHPQTCGKVERFHQTLKRWLIRQPRARGVGDLQLQLNWFRDYYNRVRPHRALGRGTPEEAFGARPKTGPPPTPGTTARHCRVRRDVIDVGGRVSLRHNSRLHHIGVGRRYAGTRVLVMAYDLQVRVVSEEGELLRDLILDPSRDYQGRTR
jgi:transposase InsO family protein